LEDVGEAPSVPGEGDSSLPGSGYALDEVNGETVRHPENEGAVHPTLSRAQDSANAGGAEGERARKSGFEIPQRFGLSAPRPLEKRFELSPVARLDLLIQEPVHAPEERKVLVHEIQCARRWAA
jgi:hypothetical protein